MATEKCKATSTTTGERCANYPRPGQKVCRFHGGNAPQAIAAAEIRVRVEKAEKAISKNLRPGPKMTTMQEVYDELLEVASTTRDWREMLTERVKGLRKLGYKGVVSEQIKSDVILFERALDRSVKVGETIVKLDLETRRQALDEKTGATVVRLLRGVLDEIDLTDEQRAKADALVPVRLRELSAVL